MAQESASRPVRRFQISTRDEAEAEEFIRQIYIGNHSRFHGTRADARFTVTAAEAAGIAASHVRSTARYLSRLLQRRIRQLCANSGCGRSLNGRDGAAVNYVLTARDGSSAR